MSVLFCHDGPMFFEIQEKQYVLNPIFLYRYEQLGKLTIFSRANKNFNKDKPGYLAERDKVECVSCPGDLSFKSFLQNKKEIKKSLTRLIKRNDYIIIRLPSRIGLIAIELTKKLKKKYLVEMVACPWDAFWNHSIKGKMAAPYMYFATKKAVRNASHVIYVTNEFLQKRYPTKGHNTNISNVALKDNDEQIMQKRMIKIDNCKAPLKLCTIAAVNVKYKGQEYVIKALSYLKKQGKLFNYVLVGGGDNSRLKKITKKYKVEDLVEFKGAMEHKDIFNELDNIDIYIQPSNQEGLPRAVIEAMSRGCPIIGSSTGGIPELLDKENIFKRKNYKKLIQILDSITKERMVKSAKENYIKSLEYQNEILETRRAHFFEEFKSGKN